MRRFLCSRDFAPCRKFEALCQKWAQVQRRVLEVRGDEDKEGEESDGEAFKACIHPHRDPRHQRTVSSFINNVKELRLPWNQRGRCHDMLLEISAFHSGSSTDNRQSKHTTKTFESRQLHLASAMPGHTCSTNLVKSDFSASGCSSAAKCPP